MIEFVGAVFVTIGTEQVGGEGWDNELSIYLVEINVNIYNLNKLFDLFSLG